MKTVSPIRWTYIGIGLLCALVAGSNLTGRDDSEFLMSPQVSLHDRAENESVSGSASEPDENSIEDFEKRRSFEESADSLARLRLRKSLSVVRQEGLLAFSPDELKILHARQQQEIDYSMSDMNAVVIEAANDGDRGITLLELRALHEQQDSESNSVYDGAEIVILASEDGSPALSLSALRAMHDQQQQNIEAMDDADDIVIRGSEDGSDGLSRADVSALHARQRALLGKSGDLAQDYAAPLPKAGDAYLTIDELQRLHKNQTRNKDSY